MKKQIEFKFELNNPLVGLIIPTLLVIIGVKMLNTHFTAINDATGFEYANRNTLASCIIDLKKKYTDYDDVSEYYVYDVMEQDAGSEEMYYMTRFNDRARNEVYVPYIKMVKSDNDSFDAETACIMLEASLKSK